MATTEAITPPNETNFVDLDFLLKSMPHFGRNLFLHLEMEDIMSCSQVRTRRQA